MSNKILTAFFIIFIFSFFIVSLFIPQKDFSENENRSLQGLPTPTAESIFNPKGDSFMQKYEDYLADQFPLRDALVSLKSLSETRLLQKSFNNGIYICDDRLIKKLEVNATRTALANLEKIEAFAQKSPPCYLMLIPSAAQLLKDSLPPFATSFDEAGLIGELYNSLENVTPIDIMGALEEQREEYIFYRTDHHWTSLGAYIAYGQLCSAMGLEAGSFEISQVSYDFSGTLISESKAFGIKPDTMTAYIGNSNVTLSVFDGAAWQEHEGLFYDEALLTKDKYKYYLGQNNPIVNVISGNDKGKILIFKDSYSHTLAQMLVDNFSLATYVDLRYLTDIEDYINVEDYDAVLFIYSTDVFCNQRDIMKLG